MSKIVYRKGIVLGIICLFIGISILPSIGGYNENDIMDEIKDEIIKSNFGSSFTTEESNANRGTLDINDCWWTMYQNNAQHTGYSDGKGLIYSKPKLLWILEGGTAGSPAIGDVDNDGSMEVIFCDNHVRCCNGLNDEEKWDFRYSNDGGVGYTRIQDAIGVASNGDRVYVYDDSSPYTEYLEED